MIRISPQMYHRITAVAAILLGLIVVSGAAVRLTGSGLGCSDWPTCEQGQLVADFEYHALIEFGNRLVTGLVSAIVIAAVLGSLLRIPKRADLTLWALGLVAGVIAQIVLGGLLVLSHLDPRFTIGHFLLSMVLVWNAVVLHHRAGLPETPTRRTPTAEGASIRHLRTALFIMGMIVLGSGTLVTGAGPHGGDDAAARLNFSIPSVARFHGLAVMALLAITIAVVVRMWQAGQLSAWRRPISRYLGVLIAQAAVGYTQYFTDVPALLVGIHVLGATVVWAATVQLVLELRSSTTPLAEHIRSPHERRAEPVRTP